MSDRHIVSKLRDEFGDTVAENFKYRGRKFRVNPAVRHGALGRYTMGLQQFHTQREVIDFIDSTLPH